MFGRGTTGRGVTALLAISGGTYLAVSGVVVAIERTIGPCPPADAALAGYGGPSSDATCGHLPWCERCLLCPRSRRR